MSKVYISVPEQLLGEIDRSAAERGLSRSGFIQEASARYMRELDAEQAERERTERMRAAYQRMRELSAEIGDVDLQARLRADRDRDGRTVNDD